MASHRKIKSSYSFGRIHRIKGLDLLVEAYADLVEEMPEVRLVITGPDDNFLGSVMDRLKERKWAAPVFATGPLYHRVKLAAYVDADLYVLPSRYETFPFTVLEAWACGCPVVVTQGCLIADIVRSAGLVSQLDKDELREQIDTSAGRCWAK